MAWYGKMIKASSGGWQDGFDETLGDVQRYLYDAFTMRVYITKLAGKKYTVSCSLYHLQEGICMWQDFWRFEATEGDKARRVYKEVSTAVKKVCEDFKTNDIPNPMLHTYMREAVRFIAPEAKPSCRIPHVDWARSIPCESDWRKTLYPNRYPESDGF
jgi:hypothetical protein